MSLGEGPRSRKQLIAKSVRASLVLGTVDPQVVAEDRARLSNAPDPALAAWIGIEQAALAELPCGARFLLSWLIQRRDVVLAGNGHALEERVADFPGTGIVSAVETTEARRTGYPRDDAPQANLKAQALVLGGLHLRRTEIGGVDDVSTLAVVSLGP